MPRRPRIKLADVPQHLVQRGVNREPCFFAEEDCHCYLHWLQEAAADWRCAIHAYALMTNHVHLLVTSRTTEGPADPIVTPHPLYLALGRSQEARQSAYRALFRSQLDEAALADIRLAIAQGQPLGNDRFREAVCAATGVRQLLPRRGRPAGKVVETGMKEEQTDFGF